MKHLEESLAAAQQNSQAKDAQLPQLRRELDHLRAELTKTKAIGDQLKAKEEELKKLEYERGSHLQLAQELRAGSDRLQTELQQLRVELDGAKVSAVTLICNAAYVVYFRPLRRSTAPSATAPKARCAH